jgi:fatty acid desaturase
MAHNESDGAFQALAHRVQQLTTRVEAVEDQLRAIGQPKTAELLIDRVVARQHGIIGLLAWLPWGVVGAFVALSIGFRVAFHPLVTFGIWGVCLLIPMAFLRTFTHYATATPRRYHVILIGLLGCNFLAGCLFIYWYRYGI